VHLDIAESAWTDKESGDQRKGMTGAMTRTLLELLPTLDAPRTWVADHGGG
jgi:leucyl aminopeptidase